MILILQILEIPTDLNITFQIVLQIIGISSSLSSDSNLYIYLTPP